MKQTPNYNLKLPAPSDTLDIEVLDENFQSLDAFIAALQSGKADINSPQFTGTPKSVTPSASDNSTRIATTAFVQGLIAGLQSSLSNKADKASPQFTGTPKSTTPSDSDNSTRIATTAFVQTLMKHLDMKLMHYCCSIRITLVFAVIWMTTKYHTPNFKTEYTTEGYCVWKTT